MCGGRSTHHATAAAHIVSRPPHGEENGVRVGQKRKNRKVIISLRPCDKAVYSDWESNPDQRFRKPTFYPLNYQSEFLSFALLLTSEEAITLVCKDKKKKLYIC